MRRSRRRRFLLSALLSLLLVETTHLLAPAAKPKPGASPCAKPNACSSNATCTNNRGTAACTCKPGYMGDGKVCTPVSTGCGSRCGSGGSSNL
jgi:hypothetical protein